MTRILVIEDEQDVRDDIVEILSYEGYEVFAAANGYQGIETARETRPDLIVCDVIMPSMDGYSVLQEVRADAIIGLTPFIFLTALASRGDQRQGMELGADDYLTKPFTLEELTSAVRTRLLKQSRLHDAYLAQLENVRDTLVYTLPHELRTPLVTILGYADLLSQDATDEFTRNAAYSILRSGNRLHRVIENYLLYAQLALIESDPERSAMMQNQTIDDVTPVIQACILQAAENANRKDDLRFQVEPERIRVAPDTLHKILMELTENAFKFSHAGTVVTVEGQREKDGYMITITDQGRGMSREQIDQINAHVQFERKLHEQQGLGMGLAIARKMTTLSNGHLSIQSHPGRGTRVELRFPAV